MAMFTCLRESAARMRVRFEVCARAQSLFAPATKPQVPTSTESYQQSPRAEISPNQAQCGMLFDAGSGRNRKIGSLQASSVRSAQGVATITINGISRY